MVARATLKSGHWMLFAVFAMAPTAVFAQQDNASQSQKQQDQHQQEEAQTNSKAAKGQTEKVEPQTQTESTERRTEASQAKKEEELISVPGGKALGMSILGNQEAPKALVIVPWKRSELGNALGVSTMLDDSRLPIDKEVFMRMLSYYEIRSEPAGTNSAPTERNVSPDTTSNGRKK